MRQIAQLGAEILRKKAAVVTDIDSIETRQIVEAMQSTLANTQGVGLAAPQISESKRIIIVASRPTPRYPSALQMEPTIMFNPSFQALSNDKEKNWEGCLSIPGIRALVPRYKDIMINYTDQQGQPVELKLDGFVARIFQHEYDHLEGKVYLDRVEDNKDIFTESEYFKIQMPVL